MLDRLFDQGEEPMRLLGAFAMQLRKLAQATRRTAQGATLGTALQQAGVPPFAARSAENADAPPGPTPARSPVRLAAANQHGPARRQSAAGTNALRAFRAEAGRRERRRDPWVPILSFEPTKSMARECERQDRNFHITRDAA